ncbi:hypothetical protein SAMN04489857_1080 [Parafannyhessea umbonata]|uniref:Uncharacterized protein n=1 Tax=Parafannyhessea umbonata TaxID=604330 RepID=A0A1H1LQ92_9ACTN|nr:hypothetical protein SAMN04489857_1080 [Parafannyhessea umbonata]
MPTQADEKNAASWLRLRAKSGAPRKDPAPPYPFRFSAARRLAYSDLSLRRRLTTSSPIRLANSRAAAPPFSVSPT